MAQMMLQSWLVMKEHLKKSVSLSLPLTVYLSLLVQILCGLVSFPISMFQMMETGTRPGCMAY